MIEMYSNGNTTYWSTDNEIIDEEGSSKRLPKLSEYQQTLGSALQKIQELQKELSKNKDKINCNKDMK